MEGERKRRGTERKVMRQDFSTTRTKTELKASPRPRSSNERSEENSTKNGRRSSELREESSARKPEIALPPAGKLRRPHPSSKASAERYMMRMPIAYDLRGSLQERAAFRAGNGTGYARGNRVW